MPTANQPIVTERGIKVPTAAGNMPATLHYLNSDAPIVVLFHDAPGLRDELTDMARRIAQQGYCCVLPDLYYRLGYIRLDLTRRSEAHAAVYRALSASLTNAMVADDTQALLAQLHKEIVTPNSGFATLGFSIGARFAIQAAGPFGSDMKAAISICGTGLVTEDDDSPHRWIGPGDCAYLFEFAEQDPAVPATAIDTLRMTLQRSLCRHQIVISPATQHGYSFPLRPMYNHAASEQSWQRVFAVLKHSLLP